MNGEPAVPAQNRTVTVAIIVAAVALGAFALVGIGVLLGWIPRGAVPDAPPVGPGASAPARGQSNGLQKFSGSEPLMPKYSQPHAPPPAPAQSLQPEAKTAATQAMPVPAPMPVPAAPAAGPQRGRFASEDSFGPAPPVFGRAEPRETPVPAPQRRRACDECGRIIGIANWRSGWEVRVRFDDGSTQTLRFRRRPPFDLGERVRLDDGELLPD
ncbi:MAG TPA: hypothetical protein VFK48_03600 [Usitatibacter sp.]|nr:hypothetical protein [Usitatibacter sp.]